MRFIKALLTSLLILLLANSAFAVSEFLIEVRDSGGDYTTILLAESGLDEDITLATTKVFSFDANSGTIPDGTAVSTDGGATTGTAIHQSINGQILIKSISGGTFDDNDIVTDGTNTVTLSDSGDGANIRVIVYNDQSIDGNPSIDGGNFNSTNTFEYTGDASIWDGTCNNAIKINLITYVYSSWMVSDSNLTISNFCFVGDGTPSYGLSSMNEATDNTYTNLILKDIGFYVRASSFIASNIVIIDAPEHGIKAQNGNYLIQNFYNLTVINAAAYGINDYSEDWQNRGVHIYNAVIYGSGTADIHNEDGGGNLYECDYVVTSDGTAETCSDVAMNYYATGLTSAAFASLETGFLASGSSLIDAGNDYSATIGISTDIQGETRTGTWDIGADEYISETVARRRMIFIN